MTARRLLSAARTSRRQPLAASITAFFALAAPTVALADTWIVDSCDESSHATAGVNHGTLRYALAQATSPATLNLTLLTGCSGSKISLSTGELETTLDTLTINGPGANLLKLDASGLPSLYGNSRVLAHFGVGKLTVANIALAGGHVTHSTYSTSGGCLFSSGDVELDGVEVSGCYALVLGFGGIYAAKGGGVFANGAVVLSDSSVSGSHAASSGATPALGGGVYAGGTLTLMNSTSLHDNYVTSSSHPAFGGGAYSKGDATVTSATIASNSATSTDQLARGGGLYAHGGLTMSLVTIDSNHASTTTGGGRGGGLYVKGAGQVADSIVTNNSVYSKTFYSGGGGAYVRGSLTLDRATIVKNTADSKGLSAGGGFSVAGDLSASYTQVVGNSATGTFGDAGGFNCGGNMTLTGSTVSNNNASRDFGGLFELSQDPANAVVVIANSTISGNIGTEGGGGFYTNAGSVSIVNSTIAFNKAGSGSILSVHTAPGVALKVVAASPQLTFESSIIANNYYGAGVPDDVSMSFAPVQIGGGSNAIWHVVDPTTAADLPSNPIAGCPLLGPLRDNGGLTQTHALLNGSPGIDAGTNTLSFDFDQRGSASTNGSLDYLRVSGAAGNTSPRSDVGAYEIQQDEVIFAAGFDACLAF